MRETDVSVHTGAQPRLAYEPGIDGIRALAVVAVLLFHADVGWAKGGYLGVSVFFTLSGYLITSLLLAERSATSRISLLGFYGRRLRRLAPASLVTVAAVLVFAPWVTDKITRTLLPGDAVASLFYVANWRFLWSGQSYSELFAAPSPLQHFWSLAIEEQFYIVFPLLMVAAFKYLGSRRRILVGLCGLFVVSVVLGLTFASFDRVYYGTDVRAAELLAGAILAVCLYNRQLIAEGLSLAIGCTSIVVFAGLCMITEQSAGWLANGGFAAFSVVSCGLVIGVTNSFVLRDWVGNRPLVAIGKVSYGLYLIHWPVYLWLNEERFGGGLLVFALRIGITVALTLVSYRFLESPIRFRQALRTPDLAVATFIVALTATLGIAVARDLSDDEVVTPTEAAAARPDAELFSEDGAVLFSPNPAADPPSPSIVPIDDAPTTTTPPPPLRALVLGSATDLVTRLTAESKSGGGQARVIEVVDGVSPGCPIAPALSIAGHDGTETSLIGCAPAAATWPALVAEQRPDVVLIGLSDLDRAPIRRAGDEALPASSVDAVQRLRWVADEISTAVASLRDTNVPILLTDIGPQDDFLNAKLAETDLRELTARLVTVDETSGDGELAAIIRSVADPELDVEVGATTRILVAGDSTSIGFAEALYNAGDGAIEVLSTGRDGCPLVAVVATRWWPDAVFDGSGCPTIAESWPDYLSEFRPNAVVVVTSLMEQSEHQYTAGGSWHSAGDPEFALTHDAAIEEIHELVAPYGVPVIVADSPAITSGQFKDSQMAKDDRILAWNREILRWAQRWKSVRVLSYAAPLDVAEAASGSLRDDGVHVRLTAMTELMRSAYLPEIERLITSARVELRAIGCIEGPVGSPAFDLDRCRSNE